MSVYYSVRIPWSGTPTSWHPTSRTGPLSVLTRGAFKTKAEAHAWAHKHLRGEPYDVATYDSGLEENMRKRTSRKSKRNSRRPKRTSRRNGLSHWGQHLKDKRAVQYTPDLEAPATHEEVLFTDATGKEAVYKRFGRAVVWFEPTPGQVKKIIKGKGKINITGGQITSRSVWPNRKKKRTSRRRR